MAKFYVSTFTCKRNSDRKHKEFIFVANNKDAAKKKASKYYKKVLKLHKKEGWTCGTLTIPMELDKKIKYLVRDI